MLGEMSKRSKSTLNVSRENEVYNLNLWIPKPPSRKARKVRTRNRYEEMQDIEEEEEQVSGGRERTPCERQAHKIGRSEEQGRRGRIIGGCVWGQVG